MLGDPDRVLTGILFWNLVVNLLYFALSIVVSEQLLAAHLHTAAGVFGLSALILLLLFGEVAPKVVAAIWRRSLAPLVAWPVATVVRFLEPAIPFFRFLTMVARRALLPHIRQEPFLSPEDLENAVNVSDLERRVDPAGKANPAQHPGLVRDHGGGGDAPRGAYAAYRPPIRLADFGGKVPPGDYVAVVRKGSDDVEAAIALSSFSLLPSGASMKPPKRWCTFRGVRRWRPC